VKESKKDGPAYDENVFADFSHASPPDSAATCSLDPADVAIPFVV
jgi:hypothetical protein